MELGPKNHNGDSGRIYGPYGLWIPEEPSWETQTDKIVGNDPQKEGIPCRNP